MEIKINRPVLFKSISRVQTILEKRSNMPILSTVLITAKEEKITVSATDLELGYSQDLPADVVEEGSITIQGRKIFEILKESRSEVVHLKEKENNWVYITDGVARFNLACLPAEDYPSFVEPEGVKTVSIDAGTLEEMINKTIYAVTLEEAGFKLSGVFTEKVALEGNFVLRMVATDGHRLSLIDKAVSGIDDLELRNGVMIPKKGMAELGKLCAEGGTVQLGFERQHCVARRENAVLVIRLIETKFPDYQAVIPRGENVAIALDRIVLLEAMRKMVILSSENYRAVKISLENNVMELMSTNPDLGNAQENMDIHYSGERLEMGFNARYFIEALQTMESETVNLGFIDSSKPCLLRGEADNGFLGLIMPMRI
jgi:DNA polymerase III subunit beta